MIKHFTPRKHFILFLCVCIKRVKSAKKLTKNVKLKLLTMEDTFGLIEEIESDYDDWAQISDKCDLEKKIQIRINA